MQDNWVKRNIYLLYANTFLTNLYFDRALWVLYLGERGMNMAQVGVLEGLLHFFIVFFEVPTGIVADLYGRKRSLLIGAVISLAYALFMMIGGHFFIFSLAFGLYGLAITFKSGAQQALVYDTLASVQQESRYTRVVGNDTAFYFAALSIAQWGGGIMAESSWNLVYGSILVMQVIALIPILLMKEPKRTDVSSDTETAPRRSMREAWTGQFRDCFAVWKSEKSVRLPIIIYLGLSSAIVVVIYYAQEYFSRQGFSSAQIGFIFMIDSLVGAAAAKFIHHLEGRWAFGRVSQAFYYLFTLGLAVFAMIQGWFAVVVMLLLGLLPTAIDPLFSNFIQGKLTSQIRSTFFSMISVLSSLTIVVLFPVFGAVVDRIGFEAAYLCLVALMVLVGLFAKWRDRNVWHGVGTEA